MEGLPIISIAGLTSDDDQLRAETLEKFSFACREVGFFFAVDHGVPKQLKQTAFSRSAELFAMPLEKKVAMSIKRSAHNRGYVAIEDEKLNPEAGADQKEAFNIGSDLPETHPDVLNGKPFRGVNYWPDLPGWRDDMLEYFNACLALGRNIHHGFAQELGLSPTFFDSVLDDPIATLRLLHYPRASDSSDREDSGAGTHTDYGNVTILATDGVAGLQVQNREGQWLDAPHIEDAFVCNIGDCMMRWSNDTYRSTPHRVKSPSQERYSIAFFLEVAPEAVVDPRQIFPDQTPRYEPITCADYLTMRLNATYEHRVQES